MSDAKKHHYVPRSILRRFSPDPARGQLYVFDKAKGRSFVSSIEGAGSENHSNTVEIEGRTVSFEGVFQTNDGQLARLLDKILTDRSLTGLASEDRDILAVVVAAQI